MGKQKEAIKLAIKDEFLGQFRSAKAKAGDVLPVAWLYGDFMPSLSTKEQQALEEVISEMITDGLIAYVGGQKPTYALTVKGESIFC